MVTRREYLVSKGLAKPGRGKFSGAALAALDEARKSGTKFSDDEKPVRVPRKPKESKPTTEVGYGPIVYTYPEKEYRAVEKGSKTERSMREVCQTCRVSLVGHGCENPQIVAKDATGSVYVSIEKR